MPNKVPVTVPAPAPGVFRWEKASIWLIGCAALGLLVAWAAVVARGYASPLVLFPLIVGAVLGGSIVLWMRVLQIGHRPTIWLGALVAGLLTVAGEHYFTFWMEQHRVARNPEKPAGLHLLAPERIPPAAFHEFMPWSAERGLRIGDYTARGALAWLVWSVDGVLVLLPAMILAIATAWLPFCNHCGRWYRTVRSGKLDPLATTELCALIPSGWEGDLANGRYRLTACCGGCGPTGLILFGEDGEGRDQRRVVWLDAAGRQRAVEILDELSRRSQQECRSGDEAGPRDADSEQPASSQEERSEPRTPDPEP
jgi:hypothetical protein